MAPETLQTVTTAMKFKKTLASWKKSYDKPRQGIKKQKTLPTKVCTVVSPVVMYGCESWTIMIGWHHRLNGNSFEQTLGDGERQGSLGCYSFMGSQRVRHDLATEQQMIIIIHLISMQ